MLINFKVKNFRSIKDEVVLSLQATNLDSSKKRAVFSGGNNVALLKSVAIYGPNASGKSNIIKAFISFRRMVLNSLAESVQEKKLPAEHFKLSTETDNQPSFFEIEFFIDDERFIYGFEIDQEKVHAEWLKQVRGNKNLFNREEQKIESSKNYFKEATAALKKQTGDRVLFLTMLASNNAPTAKKVVQFVQKTGIILGPYRGRTFNYSFDKFIEDSEMKQKIKELMIQSDFGIVDIKAREEMVQVPDNIPDQIKEDSMITQRQLDIVHDKFDANKQMNEKVSLGFFNNESEGTKRMFFLSGPLLETLKHGKVLFIDEIDSSLHPILCQYLISIFNSKTKNPKNAQLVFTTHDVSLLNASILDDEKLLRRDQIYFTNKDKYGATELFSLADISERKGVDFTKRYIEGRYGALPYIAEFEDLKLSEEYEV